MSLSRQSMSKTPLATAALFFGSTVASAAWREPPLNLQASSFGGSFASAFNTEADATINGKARTLESGEAVSLYLLASSRALGLLGVENSPRIPEKRPCIALAGWFDRCGPGRSDAVVALKDLSSKGLARREPELARKFWEFCV